MPGSKIMQEKSRTSFSFELRGRIATHVILREHQRENKLDMSSYLTQSLTHSLQFELTESVEFCSLLRNDASPAFPTLFNERACSAASQPSVS